MEFSITKEDIQSFYNNKYLQETCNKTFSFTRDEINMDVLQMTVDEWKTPNLKVHLIQTGTQRDIQVTGGITEEFVMLHFVCEGRTQILNNPAYPDTIKRNTNNLFCVTEGKVEHRFNKGQNNTYFKVYFPYNYIHSLAEQHPEVFETLLLMLKKGCPFLKEGNLTTTLEMKTVIEHIKKATDMGTIASFYIETKIQELLALQMQQINNINCSNCKYYKHYQEQLNEARNLIETHYRTPPTIAQLAQHVGMSETVLKSNFKNCFGTTIYGYLFNYRMSIAKTLLSDVSMTIMEIAFKTGYEHPSHFTTAFKRKYGISPAKYRTKYN
ncbi:MAG: AraC family transcriptional regulator [Ignavibacteria bacterium]|jgi:AraC-like DNA-binding protein